jgi:hypothetical protein
MRGRHLSKRACKPNSVVCGHSSRRRVTADTHQQPTRRFRHLLEPPVAYRADTPRSLVLAAVASLPIWSCSVWGLPCLPHYCVSGALLPHLFTLTPTREEHALRGMLCSLAKAQVAEAVSSLLHWPSRGLDTSIPDVIRHTALRSSDFPPPAASHDATGSDRPARLLWLLYRCSEFFAAGEKPGLLRMETQARNYQLEGGDTVGPGRWLYSGGIKQQCQRAVTVDTEGADGAGPRVE